MISIVKKRNPECEISTHNQWLEEKMGSIDTWSGIKEDEMSILLIDDLMGELCKSKAILDLMKGISHHARYASI
jgi:hypothetical protein